MSTEHFGRRQSVFFSGMMTVRVFQLLAGLLTWYLQYRLFASGKNHCIHYLPIMRPGGSFDAEANLTIMRDILQDIQQWQAQDTPFAIATVVKTWRSAPRQAGASMLISKDMKVVGSVSGGCVEGKVIKVAQEVITSGKAQLLKFGISNEEAWSVGLSCGGGIQVFVQPFFTQTGKSDDALIWRTLQQNIESDQPVVLVTALSPEATHTLVCANGQSIGPEIAPVKADVPEAFQSRESEMISTAQGDYFLHIFPTREQLLVIGAAHISYDLVQLAQWQGFKVTVIDPRGIFTDSLAQICQPEALLQQWPEEVLPGMDLNDSVYAVMLTHDPKIDDQALHLLLRSKVAYIGALGSRKTHAKRVQRLSEAGFTPKEIERIHAPVGLPIGGISPAEIALSIMAEMVKVKHEIRSLSHT